MKIMKMRTTNEDEMHAHDRVNISDSKQQSNTKSHLEYNTSTQINNSSKRETNEGEITPQMFLS